MNPRVELVYDVDCPNVTAARSALLKAFAQAGVLASWVEYDRSAEESPAYVRGYGSPTILVNGQDVAGARPGESNDCCRLYPDGENGLRSVPSGEHIVTALTAASSPVSFANGQESTRFGWRRLMAVIPGVGQQFPVEREQAEERLRERAQTGAEQAKSYFSVGEGYDRRGECAMPRFGAGGRRATTQPEQQDKLAGAKHYE